ncbi:MAG: transposase [Rhodobacteraceae bacterium]|nr:transposase [Paracoccaceae bacterium]
MLPELMDQIAPDQEITTVTTDGAYDTRRCHNSIASRGTAVIIPPRRNAKSWLPTAAGARARNEACGPPHISAERSGDDGASITDEAVSKRKQTA